MFITLLRIFLRTKSVAKVQYISDMCKLLKRNIYQQFTKVIQNKNLTH